MDPVALGIDIGTSSIKVLALDSNGTVLAEASHPLETVQTAPGHAEQHPDEWKAATIAAVADIGRTVPGLLKSVEILGVCGAAHIPVMLDSTGSLLRRAIMWTDQRSAKVAQRLDRTHGEEIARLSLNRPTATWTLPQLRWLAEHEPDVVERLAHLLFGKDFLVAWMTAEFVTDTGNATSSMLFDAQNGRWSPRLMDLANIPERVLPVVVESSDVVGDLRPTAADALGLRAGLPVIAGALDSICELLALGVAHPGEAMLRLGTAGGVMSVREQPAAHPQLISYPFLDRGWASQAFTTSAGGSLRWLQRLLNNPDSRSADLAEGTTFAALDEAAAAVPPGADGLVFHPYLLGERAPHWDPELRASFTGLAMQHDRRHLVRAVMEGIACSMRDCHDVLADSGSSIRKLRATGGGTRSDELSQITSNVLRLPVHRMRAAGSALGAAMLAGATAGLFDDLEAAVNTCTRERDVMRPDERTSDVYGRLIEHYRAVTEALRPLYQDAAVTSETT